MYICRFCGNKTTPVIDFGEMPIANRFVVEKQLDSYRFRLSASFCTECFLFQLDEQPKPELMFHENYPFFTGLSSTMTKHFKQMALESLEDVGRSLDDVQVLEIGCNDGTLLSNLVESEIKHLGVDPSANVVELARTKGVDAQVDFFGKETASKIASKRGKFDVILAANVICHIPDMRDFAAGIEILLTDSGRFIFEEPYAGDVLDKTSYDQFYDEHVYIFSCLSVSKIFAEYGLELVDVSRQSTHGGSMRYSLAKQGAREVSSSAREQIKWEYENGLDQVSSYYRFAENCKARKSELQNLLSELRSNGKKVAGYAATSKSTTILNYCAIDSDLIQFISDSTPEKQGTYTPGTYIPVVTPEFLRAEKPDFVVLFAWNHEAEILEKERELTKSGTKWIRFVPTVEII
jgi:methylation protein EvaC